MLGEHLFKVKRMVVKIRVLKLFIVLLLISNIIIYTVFKNKETNLQNKLDALDDLVEYLLTFESKQIVLTAYNSHRWQTDDSPHETASGTKTSFQTLALSRDLIRSYNQNGITEYGDTVKIVIKQSIVEDTMNRRYVNRGDVWTDSYTEARKFGKQKAYLIYKNKKIN